MDHEALVRDIRAVSEDGANRYLEHIVVGLKSPNRTLHRDLLDRLLTRLEKELSDEGIRYHLEELGMFTKRGIADGQTPSIVF